MKEKDPAQKRMEERNRRIRERALDQDEHGYSEKTHLIHGRHQNTLWDYSHHVVPPLSSTVTYRLDTSVRGAQGFAQFGQEPDGESPIYIYDRLDEPTRGMLER